MWEAVEAVVLVTPGTADREALQGTFTVDCLVGDAEERVAHLRELLEKDKVVVMAWSLGVVLAVHLAKRRPEWLQLTSA